MDKIQSMRAFSRVVEFGTFTKAADSLSLPKPTITKLIQALEAHLRVKLLNRTPRRVNVTSDGALYYERAVRFLKDLDATEASLSRTGASPSGEIRIRIGSSMARHVLIPALGDFLEQYPQLQLNLDVGEGAIDLAADNIDCMIVEREIRDASLISRRVSMLPFVNIVSPQYAKRHGIPMHPGELVDGQHRTIVHLSSTTGKIHPLDFNNGRENLQPATRHSVSVSEHDGRVAAAKAGLGIAQCPRILATPGLARGELVEVLPDWQHPPLPINLISPVSRRVSANALAFADWASEAFSRFPDLSRNARSAPPQRPAACPHSQARWREAWASMQK